MIDRKRVRELAVASAAGVAVPSRAVPRPSVILGADLMRAVERLKAARSQYDAEAFGFRVCAAGERCRMTSTDVGPARALDRALDDCLLLAGRYLRFTRQKLRASGERSVWALGSRALTLAAAYGAIIETCPEIAGYVRRIAPDVVEVIDNVEGPVKSGGTPVHPLE